MYDSNSGIQKRHITGHHDIGHSMRGNETGVNPAKRPFCRINIGNNINKVKFCELVTVIISHQDDFMGDS